ncbi:DUF488 family protein [Aquincola sp. MAHUQ-54]|uniref:DUF488 family protein n=1 Tax=Aquincola agrisoli TaxID=3119538 RepID=A0AAW9Q7Y0_9BURK
MALRIVRLGTPRAPGEGLRLGTVRRPPRGVPKAEFASRDYYDLWLPLLSPSPELMRDGQAAADAKAWADFTRRFKRQLATPEASQLLDLLAAMSMRTNLALGCYCEDEARCHRSVLRALLVERGAAIEAG